MILTPLARSSNAIRFVQSVNSAQSNVFAVLGQPTPWSDDSAPPSPSPTAITENSPFCAFLATAQWVILNDSSGTYPFISSDGSSHLYSALATAADVISNQANLVMLTATATGAQLVALEASFRQVGFTTTLVPQTGHESDTFLPAANVLSFGNLETLENREPVSIIEASSYSVAALLQF